MIRPASLADAPTLADLWSPWITQTAITFNSVAKTAQDMESMIADRQKQHGFWVAEQEGKVLGFATYGQFRVGPGYATCMEHSIILSPNARGQGLGRALMNVLEDHARTGGARQMIAGVSAENPEGRAFHARIGYRELAVIPEAGFKFGRFIHLVLMQKFLT